jgi:hypothetical protein
VKLIRYKFSEELVQELMTLKLIDIPVEWLRENISLMYDKIESPEDVRRVKTLVEEYRKNGTSKG